MPNPVEWSFALQSTSYNMGEKDLLYPQYLI